MDMPSITHPIVFKIKGVHFKVISYKPITKNQAENVVRNFYRMRSFKKSDKGKTFTVITTID